MTAFRRLPRVIFMTKSAFRRAAAIWIGTLTGFVLLFPFLLFALVKASSCAGVGGACGALAAVIGVTLKPLGVIVLGALLVTALWRRVRGLAMNHAWGGVTVLWMLGSMAVLVGFGNFWGANFALGLAYMPPVVLLAMTMSLSFFLCFAEASAVHTARTGALAAWVVAAVAALHVTVLMLPSIVFGLMTVPFVGKFILSNLTPLISVLTHLATVASLGVPAKSVGYLQWLDFALFSAALAYLIATQDEENGPELRQVSPRSPTRGSSAELRPIAGTSSAPRASFGQRRG